MACNPKLHSMASSINGLLMQDISKHQMPTCKIFHGAKGWFPQNAIHN
jgi:hypothetical protein